MLCIMPPSSLCKVQQLRLVVFILVQAGGREMEVLQKLFQYFLLDKLCPSLKNTKRRSEQSCQWKSFPNQQGLGQVGAGAASCPEVPSGPDRVFLSVKRARR